MDTPGAKQQALEHILQTLQVMFAREAVVVALRGHAMLGCAHFLLRFLFTGSSFCYRQQKQQDNPK
jgi:hypothetical protein